MDDLHLREDIRHVLMAFMPDHLPKQMWSGYTLYCLQVACTFTHEFRKHMGTMAPGLELNSIEKMNSECKNNLKRTDVENYVQNRSKCRDVAELIHRLDQKNEDKARDAETAKTQAENDLTTLQQAHTTLTAERDNLLKTLQQSAEETKRLMDDLTSSHQKTHEKLDNILSRFENISQNKVLTIAKIVNYLEEIKTLTAAGDISKKLDQLKGMFLGNEDLTKLTEGIKTFEAESQRQRSEITSLKQQKDDIEKKLQDLQKEKDLIEQQLEETKKRTLDNNQGDVS